jgi:CRP-like cAMP-binding protein
MPASRNSEAFASRLDMAALGRAPLCAGLDRDALAEVVAAGRTHRLPKDEALFDQGAPATALHLLLQGSLKVAHAAEDGQQTVLRFVGPNEVAGVFALLGPGQLFPATVTAVVDCSVLTWEGPALRALTTRHPQIVANAMGALGARAQEAHVRLHEAAADRVEQRLANALLRLARQSGVREPDGSVRIDFPVARQDLAEMAGTTLSTTSRIMSAWEGTGILATGGRKQVTVKDPHALMRIAEG